MAKTVFQQQVEENRNHAAAQAHQHQEAMNMANAQMAQQQAIHDAQVAEKARQEKAAEMLFETKRFLKTLKKSTINAPVLTSATFLIERAHWKQIGFESSAMPDVASKTALADIVDTLEELEEGLAQSDTEKKQSADIATAFETNKVLLSGLSNDPKTTLTDVKQQHHQSKEELTKAEEAHAKWSKWVDKEAGVFLMILKLIFCLGIPWFIYVEKRDALKVAKEDVELKQTHLNSTTKKFNAYEEFLAANDGGLLLDKASKDQPQLFSKITERYQN